MKINALNIEYLKFGVLSFGEYQTPYVESNFHMLNRTIQAFRDYLDSIEKVEQMLENSKKLMTGNLVANCIGENESLISFKNDYFQFYTASISYDFCLKLHFEIWLKLLPKLKEFMENENKKSVTYKF